MNGLTRAAFIVLHVTLAAVIAIQGIGTLAHALSEHHGGHLALVGVVQTVAALLFAWPGTVRIGGIALIAIFVMASLVDALHGSFPGAELVYAAAAFFVTVQGSGWRWGRQLAAS
jgi:hypothetical protein